MNIKTKKHRITKKTCLAAILLTSLFTCAGCQKKETGIAQIGRQDAPAIVEAASNRTSLSLDLGECIALPLSDGEVVSHSHANNKIVSVSKDGTVHGLRQGETKITVDVESGEDSDVRTYHVKVRKRGMVYPTFTMMAGEHLDMQFSRKGTRASWKSSNPSIAKVTKSGKVIAKKKGSAKITGITKKNKRFVCKLKVTKRIKNVIYLTFDDGPNRYTTPKILNCLKKNHVKATFFELKPAKKDFDLTKRIIGEGHTLALHGYQHKYNIIYKSQKVYHNNLDHLRNLFFAKYGVWCTVSRFPGGSSNTCSKYTPGIMTQLTRKLDGWGYHYFDWNVDSRDAGGARNSSDVFRNVKNSLIKGRGNVVLMHDYYKNDKTIHSLEKIIRYGKKNGYTFLPITASTTEVHHQVNN